MAAVAPVPKQFTKHSRPRHSDEPLSDSGGEEPRKIRSYIKPNKNVNTYREAMRDQRMVARLINGQRPVSGTSKRPTAAVKPIFPIRQELHDINSRNPEKVPPKLSTAAKNPHPTPTPTTSKAKHSEIPTISAPAHVKNTRSSPPTAPSSLSGKPGSAPKPGNTTFSRKNTEGPRSGVGSHTNGNEKQSFKRRDIPKPPPLPQKRAQAPSSAKLDRPQSSHQQEWKDSSPPAKKLREEPRTSSPPAAIIDQRVEEETTRPRVGTTLDETLKESWYLRVMESNAAEDKTAGRMSKNDNAAAERSNIGCNFVRESTPKKGGARSCENSTTPKSNPASHEGLGNSSPDQCRMSSVYVPGK
ncbi:hypothetical protein ANCDUO_07270 [Ancylostoma duodenale]|uniref:Uncharacterized protein n=1 Tax=Ancylostoma duodenale TaxID=51022 RepID=A0A0C2CZG8_9BILA|nr:hypothetical protein ANCDUO_07270 [Ancylostoma duodenale]